MGPARYVSGYIETDPPPGKPRFAGADAPVDMSAIAYTATISSRSKKNAPRRPIARR